MKLIKNDTLAMKLCLKKPVKFTTRCLCRTVTLLKNIYLTIQYVRYYDRQRENHWFKVEPVEWVKDPSGVWFTKQVLLEDIKYENIPQVLYEFSKTAFSECRQGKVTEEELYSVDWQFRSLEEKQQIIATLQKEKEIQAQIAQTRKRLDDKPRLKGVSGVVIADEIAKKQLSGEEKRVVTPKVGKELRQEIMKNLKKQVKE